jgi:hypothetical protein
MSSTGQVPETRLLGEGELSADHAWRTLRRYGSWQLLRDGLVRFRSGDGFSHARALGLQLCLAAVPLLIALNGLATKLGDPHRGGRVVADTVLALTPGASESLVSQLLTDPGGIGAGAADGGGGADRRRRSDRARGQPDLRN